MGTAYSEEWVFISSDSRRIRSTAGWPSRRLRKPFIFAGRARRRPIPESGRNLYRELVERHERAR
jgi:hypothetical protein